MAHGQRSTRRAGVTREDLLARAIILVDEAPDTLSWAEALRHVTAQATADALGTNRTLIYKLWPTQHEFWSDLARYVMLPDDGLVATLAASAPGPDVASGSLPRHAMARQLERLQAGLDRERHLALHASVLGYDIPRDVADMMTIGVRRSAAQIETWLVHWLRARQRRPIDAVTIADLAGTLQILMDGTRLLGLVAPWTLTMRASLPWLEGSWGVLPLAFELVLHHLTTEGPLAADECEPRAVPPVPGVAWSPRQVRALEAASMLLESAASDPHKAVHAFGWISIARLARIAQVSRHTAYRHWPNDDELRLAVLEGMCAARRVPLDSFTAQMADPRLDGVGVAEIRSIVHRLLMPGELTGVRSPILAFVPYLAHPRVAHAIHDLHRSSLGYLQRNYERYPVPHPTLTAEHRAVLAHVGWYGGRRRVLVECASGRSADAERSVSLATALSLIVPAVGTGGVDAEVFRVPPDRAVVGRVP